MGYTLRAALSGSLSSEVSVELPCRIVNFVSLDPPPGHDGSLSKVMPQPPASLPIHTAHIEHASSKKIERMASMESLSIMDLNRMYGGRGMMRGMSHDSSASEWTSSSGMSRAHTLASIEEASPPLPANAREVVQKAQERQLRHQMSLDCIGSAIASATARRQGHIRTQSALFITQAIDAEEEEDIDAEEEEDEDIEPISPMDHMRAQYSGYPTPLPDPNVVQLDELNDVPEDPPRLPIDVGASETPASYAEHVQVHENDWLAYEDESEDEVDLVLQTKQFDSDEDRENVPPAQMAATAIRRAGLLSPTKASTQRATVKSPSLASGRNTPSSPSVVRSPVTADALALSAKSTRSLSFGVASPTSPIKKGPAGVVSPRSRQICVQADRLAPPRATTYKAPFSPRTAALARQAQPVQTTGSGSGSPASVKGRVAALETRNTVRKSASLSTIRPL